MTAIWAKRMRASYLLLFFVILSFTFKTGEGLKCYTCSSVTNPKCADPVADDVQSSECSNNLINEAAQGLNNVFGKIAEIGKVFGVQSKTPIKVKSEQFGCMKTVTEEGSMKIVVRSCGVNPEVVDMCKGYEELSKDNDKFQVSYCGTCTSDLCNGSPLTASAVLPLIIFPAAALLLANT